jgi:hypothetical protein
MKTDIQKLVILGAGTMGAQLEEHAALVRPGNFEDDWSCLADADWVFEAVVEDAEVKRQLLGQVAAAGLDPGKVNVNGGAVALGHPLGCTGAKLTTQLLHEMARRSSRYGLVTMCVGGGMGAAGIFERL